MNHAEVRKTAPWPHHSKTKKQRRKKILPATGMEGGILHAVENQKYQQPNFQLKQNVAMGQGVGRRKRGLVFSKCSRDIF